MKQSKSERKSEIWFLKPPRVRAIAFQKISAKNNDVVAEDSNIGKADADVLREREQLAQSGILVINLSIDKRSNRLLEEPEIITRGFVSADDVETLVPAIRKRVKDVIQKVGVRVEKDILDVVRTFIFGETKRRPMVFVTMTRV